MKNEIIEWPNSRWLVKQAISREAAVNAIASARVSGSVGATHKIDKSYVGGEIEVIADVVQINSDNTERKPYTEAY